jgi:hypothetical protein
MLGLRTALLTLAVSRSELISNKLMLLRALMRCLASVPSAAGMADALPVLVLVVFL